MNGELTELSPTCPYCWEPTDILVEPEQVGHPFVEDCVVCCHPIRFLVSADVDGDLMVDAAREND